MWVGVTPGCSNARMHSKREIVLAGFARRQLGIATRAHLLGASLTRHQIDHLIAIGRLERLFNSVYRVAGVGATYPQMLLAACWAGGDRGAIGLTGAMTPPEAVKPRRCLTSYPAAAAR